MSDSQQKNSNRSLNTKVNKLQFIPDSSFEDMRRERNALDPQKIISIILRYKWLVLLCIVTGAATAWVYSDRVTPTFESNGTLLITSSNESSDSELLGIISQATGIGINSTFANELQVLQSRQFSRRVASKLVAEEPGGISEFPILWEVEENGDIYKAGVETVAGRIRNDLSFRQPAEESQVIEISFVSPSPREAAKIVNYAMEIYVENSTQQNRQAAQSTAEFLKKERQDIREKLEASEEKLRAFMDATGIVQVDEQAASMVNRRTDIEAELQRVNLELETIEQAILNHERQLERIKPGLAEQFAKAIGPRIRESQENLAQYERERTLIISKNPGVLEREPVPPRLVFVNEQIELLKGKIKHLSDQLFTEDDEYMGMDGETRAELVTNIQRRLVELRIEQNQYRSRRDALIQHKGEIDASFNALPQDIIDLAKLQRDVKINEELYLNVSRQYADLSIWKQSQFGFGRIIDPAKIAKVPVSPNKKILVLIGIMLGGFLSAGIIVLKEFKDNSVKSVDQLRTIYLPTLSVVPTFEKKSKKNRKSFSKGKGVIPDELELLQDPASFAAESIRRLKNNIIYQYGYIPPKTISVTSPEKGDGKSTIVANLGVAFAGEGYKTLIIDADFRRPKIAKYFGLSDEAGLTNYLSGSISFQQLIQSTDLDDLKVVAAGSKTHKPEVITSSNAFRQLRKKMEEIFDVIIMDTPPFGIISDSMSLLKETEATLLIVGYRKTNWGMLLRTTEELERIQANLSGIVLNKFDHRKEVGQYYGAGYYQALYSNYEEYVK